MYSYILSRPSVTHILFLRKIDPAILFSTIIFISNLNIFIHYINPIDIAEYNDFTLDRGIELLLSLRNVLSDRSIVDFVHIFVKNDLTSFNLYMYSVVYQYTYLRVLYSLGLQALRTTAGTVGLTYRISCPMRLAIIVAKHKCCIFLLFAKLIIDLAPDTVWNYQILPCILIVP